MSGYPPLYIRKANFARDANAGLALSAAKVDAEANGIQTTLNALVSWVRNITNADNTLKNFGINVEALAGSERFVATAAQAVFQTAIPWDATFDSSNVEVFSGGTKIDPNLITPASYTSGTAKLQVTIPAQAVGAVVVVNAFASGAGLLALLADASVSTSGAGLVGFDNTVGGLSSTTAQAALVELANALAALTTGVGTTADLIRRTGSVPFTADQSMGSHKLTNVADGTSAQDAVTVNQLSAYTAVWNALQSYFLKLDGSTTMAGALAMGAQKITGLANGTVSTDAVALGQLGSYVKTDGTVAMAAALAMGGFKITGLASGVAATDAVTKTQLDGVAALVGGGNTIADYASAGTFSLTLGAGTTSVRMKIWGSGGGGGLDNYNGGGGGGGGGFVETIQTVPPSAVLTLVIGAGGAAGAPGNASYVQVNGSTVATGGAGAAGAGVSGGAGGSGSFSGSNGAVYSGNAGQAGTRGSDGISGDGGGSACSSGGGHGDRYTGAVAATTPSGPGGGGGGSQTAAAPGAAGRITLFY